jgi:hypothetical protein
MTTWTGGDGAVEVVRGAGLGAAGGAVNDAELRQLPHGLILASLAWSNRLRSRAAA